ncbi:BPSL1445 family SYLF domain-containing lipoprotein [Futiania mangrovi]|uniref:YSC84-related protein n=1 Tax=Futiania mangrovi TaxID=2959716 RepID=A0A9J6PFE0_9PROT|nr:YSC84-related protein [Futiania mangrovii]MCP1337174.1 YSC84-related protein [Futiania mangrovii]
MIRALSTLALAAVAVLAVALAPAQAATKSKAEIDAGVTTTLDRFYKEFAGGRDLMSRASGALVFPTITKGGFIVGGEYGEGALLIDGAPVAYYSSASASIGFQAGLQSRSQIIFFMTDKALADFRAAEGWEAGVDASITVIEEGASGKLSTETAKQPVIGVVFAGRGLMGGISLDGTKVTKIDPQ